MKIDIKERKNYLLMTRGAPIIPERFWKYEYVLLKDVSGYIMKGWCVSNRNSNWQDGKINPDI